MEPISHFFYSDRLKLQFWDYGQDGRPSLVLVHGGLDHARNWDWVARSLREHYHVYALDLRGHGNSAWAPGAAYSIVEHVLDLSALLDIIDDFPIRLVGHSLGGVIVLHYAGVYPDRVRKAVSIEGLGFPQKHRVHGPASERMRRWIEDIRGLEKRQQRSYPDIDAAMARMKEKNPHLSDEVARHLTLHGTNWDADGSLVWKFDNYVRVFSPYGHHVADVAELYGQIASPTLMFWGLESFSPAPEADPRLKAIRNCRLVKVPNSGHWVHHDQLDLFLNETTAFLQD
ncbi:MAG TPA: alpha/beta hydrolase [Candidatus Acidoferrales bacterium]|nr:alpha/beta hydrolase [Candidatus Acidoferrales bacterium]